MSREFADEVQDLFLAAVERPEADRLDWLQEHCTDEKLLRILGDPFAGQKGTADGGVVEFQAEHPRTAKSVTATSRQQRSSTLRRC